MGKISHETALELMKVCERYDEMLSQPQPMRHWAAWDEEREIALAHAHTELEWGKDCLTGKGCESPQGIFGKVKK